MKAFEWADANSVEEAVALTVKGASYKAAGMDLVDLMKERIAEPTRLVNIRNIKGLDQIEAGENGLKIGPLVTLTQLAENDEVRKNYTALALAAGHAATPNVRNVATAGGNLLQRPRCWYFRNEQFPCRKKGGEICFAQEGENQYHALFNNKLCAIVHPSSIAPPLMAMNAVIDITGPKGKREVELNKFFVLPNQDLHRENSLEEGEIITAIRVPKPAASAKSFYMKQGEKESFDWPIAEVAAVLEMDGETCRKASIVLGAASPVPHRPREAEGALDGKKIDQATARAAADAAMAQASPMTQNGYKVALFKVIIARTILAAAKGEKA